VLRLVKKPEAAQPDALAGVARAAAAGDPAAVRTLLVTLGPHLLRSVRRVLGAAHPDVDDVTQESAFAVMHALPRYRGESSVLHFACRVAVLTAMSVRRRDATLKRRSIRDDDASLELVPSGLPAPDAVLSTRDAAEVVRELLDALPVEQAEVLALHCVLGYTVREIADAAGVPLETVRSRLRLSKQAIRERVLTDPRFEGLLEESS
jgi:RNA polymerase sigma-70 factor (ECF subfamily)